MSKTQDYISGKMELLSSIERVAREVEQLNISEPKLMNITFSPDTLNALSKVSPSELQSYIEIAIRRQLVADKHLKPVTVSDYNFHGGYGGGGSCCSVDESPF